MHKAVVWHDIVGKWLSAAVVSADNLWYSVQFFIIWPNYYCITRVCCGLVSVSILSKDLNGLSRFSAWRQSSAYNVTLSQLVCCKVHLDISKNGYFPLDLEYCLRLWAESTFLLFHSLYFLQVSTNVEIVFMSAHFTVSSLIQISHITFSVTFSEILMIEWVEWVSLVRSVLYYDLQASWLYC